MTREDGEAEPRVESWERPAVAGRLPGCPGGSAPREMSLGHGRARACPPAIIRISLRGAGDPACADGDTKGCVDS